MSQIRKRRERRASSRLIAVAVQLPEELIAAIDRWAELMKVAPPTAIRKLLERAVAEESRPVPTRAAPGSRVARAAYAEKAAGEAIDRSFKDSSHSESVKASRKRRLTTIPSELSRGRGLKRSRR